MDLTCIHTGKGLCPSCRQEYDTDPCAWIEFGDHPRGLANWAAELRLQEADRAAVQEAWERAPVEAGDEEIPF